MPLIEDYPPDIQPWKPASQVDMNRFDDLVGYAIHTLPDDVRRHTRRVAFLVENGADDMYLLGLFRGIPLTKKTNNDGGMLPDTITLYRIPILSVCVNEKQVYEQIVVTLRHEVGHFFGLDHDVLGKHGYQ